MGVSLTLPVLLSASLPARVCACVYVCVTVETGGLPVGIGYFGTLPRQALRTMAQAGEDI